MAAWQVDFYVIPRRALASHGAVDSSDLDARDWWGSHALPADYQKRLSAIASIAPSSSAELETWGSQDGNRIDVRSRDGRASAVVVRVDVRRLDSKFGAALLQFVRAADAVLVRSDGLVVQPQISAYAAALRGSEAWRFASDPAAYLKDYSDTDDDEQ
jgi:hypothetical protein